MKHTPSQFTVIQYVMHRNQNLQVDPVQKTDEHTLFIINIMSITNNNIKVVSKRQREALWATPSVYCNSIQVALKSEPPGWCLCKQQMNTLFSSSTSCQLPKTTSKLLVRGKSSVKHTPSQFTVIRYAMHRNQNHHAGACARHRWTHSFHHQHHFHNQQQCQSC